jgi:hypothetical protein
MPRVDILKELTTLKSRLIRMVLAGLIAATAWAASVDGKWDFETTQRNQKKGTESTLKVTLDLKTDGSTLKGAVITHNPRRDVTASIQDGKISGDQISFVTVNQNPKGDVKFTWTGTLSGDDLRGTRTREGAKRGVDFNAKRQK